MSRAARSLFVFGIYLVGLGATLLIAPGVILGLFRLPNAHEVWIRLLGTVTFNVGVYYVVAARFTLTPIILASVPVRMLVMGVVATLVATGSVEPQVILFGVADLAGAVWTFLELRRQARPGSGPSPTG